MEAKWAKFHNEGIIIMFMYFIVNLSVLFMVYKFESKAILGFFLITIEYV